ncbi:MAG: ABC-type transport auxiliary lipoprotein family protein [Deltaproteobacteria bacterium]|nr:ABC-type transport auxiliary lipoprotein family protein [Deltaproteobacteria bacterium]
MKALTKIFIAASLSFFICGCGLSQPYPVIRSFTLELQGQQLQAQQMQGQSKRETLSLKKPFVQVTASGSVASYETRKLIHKVGPNELSEDFYNEFTGMPARMVADETARFLDSGPLAHADRTVSLKGPDYVLELFLQTFHGDYTLPTPQATVEVRFTFTDAKRGEAVLLAKTYRGACPIAAQGDAPSELVSALGSALTEILTELQIDLKKAIDGGRKNAF